MGIITVLDLLQHYPRRYHDRTNTQDIADLALGEEATVYGEVKKVSARRTRHRRTIVEAEVFDGTSYLRLTFFNQPWRERQLAVGVEAAFFGRVEHYRGRRQMINPIVDILGKAGDRTGVLVPVYPASGKAEVHSWQLGDLVKAALERTRERGFADPLDDDIRGDLGLADRTGAMWDIHRPDELARARNAAERLTFDEFLRMQVGLVARKRALEQARTGIAQKGRSSTRSSPGFRSHSPTISSGRSPTFAPISRAPRRCTGCSRARSARGRRWSRCMRCLSVCRVATRVPSWRRPRCSRSSIS